MSADKTVDEMADELCMAMNGYSMVHNGEPEYLAKYHRLARHVLDLIAQAKPAPSPGDGMTDEEVAREMYAAFLEGDGGVNWISWKNMPKAQRDGLTNGAARARELFRPGTVAPEVNKDELAECKDKLKEANEELERLRVDAQVLRANHGDRASDCAVLARYVRDLLACLRVKDEMDDIEHLAGRYGA